VLTLPEGRVVFLELKAEGGKLRSEQKRLQRMFLFLRHEWYQVRSFKRFLEIVSNAKT
jgi:hypothetical protein